MLSQSQQYLHQRASTLAGLDHVYIHLWKNTGMLRQGRGEVVSFAHVMQQLLTDRRRHTAALKVDHTAQGSGQRHTCLQQICQLPRVIGKFLQLGLGLTAPTRSVLSKRRLRRGRLHRRAPACDGNRKQSLRRDLGHCPITIGRLNRAARLLSACIAGCVFENWHYFMTPAGFKLPRR